MFPLCAYTISLILTIANNNNMKSFQEFLIEGAKQVQCDINGICKVIKEYESAGNEEKVLSVYKDSKGLSTIGHGHLVTPESSKIFSELNISPDILSGKGKLTPDQANKLLERDVKTRLPQVQKLVPKFNEYSTELQGQLASEQFRGMLGKSPSALKKLSAGDFSGASTEYLNAKDYRESVRDKTGIAPRMKKLADAIRTEPERQKKRQQSSQQTTQAPQSPSTSQTQPSR
jgi:GH24 family phage-related lysozyme (muramidase)